MPKVIHYRRKCIGCGVCYEQQPELWRMSKKDGKATLIRGSGKKRSTCINNTGCRSGENQGNSCCLPGTNNQSTMNGKIKEFIEKQTCGNLACVDETGHPWCFSFFYSWDAENGLLHYKSSQDTKHSLIINAHPYVAGTILPDKLNLLQIKGIQFEGIVLPSDHKHSQPATAHYHKKHPVALVMPGDVWTIQVNHIKFTDNSLGFGKKLIWDRASL